MTLNRRRATKTSGHFPSHVPSYDFSCWQGMKGMDRVCKYLVSISRFEGERQICQGKINCDKKDRKRVYRKQILAGHTVLLGPTLSFAGLFGWTGETREEAMGPPTSWEDINIDEHIGFTLVFDEMFHGPEPVSQIKKIPSTPTHTTSFLSKLWFVSHRCGHRLALKISLSLLSSSRPSLSGVPH